MILHLVVIFIFCSAGSLSAREFTDIKGRKIEADFAGIEGKKVKLRLKSGKVVSYPIAKLSAGDIEYLKNHPGRGLPPVRIDPRAVHYIKNEYHDYVFLGLDGKIRFNNPGKGIILRPEPFYQGVCLVNVGGIANAFMNYEGKLLLESRNMGVCMFFGRWGDDLIQCFENSKHKNHGYLKHDGSIAIPYQFTLAKPMRNGAAWVSRTPRPKGGFRSNDKVEWELIDKSGKTLVKLPVGSTCEPFSSGYSLVVPRGADGKRQKPVFYDNKGKLAFVDKDLQKVRKGFIHGYCVVGNNVMDTKGNWTFEAAPGQSIIRKGKMISDGVVLVRDYKQESKRLVINVATGGVVATLPNEHYYQLCGSGLIAFCHGDTSRAWRCLDRLGNMVIDEKLASAPEFYDGFAKAGIMKNGKAKSVMLNSKGKAIYEFKR